jgi:3-methyladenine DNA glycosylase Tag
MLARSHGCGCKGGGGEFRPRLTRVWIFACGASSACTKHRETFEEVFDAVSVYDGGSILECGFACARVGTVRSAALTFLVGERRLLRRRGKLDARIHEFTVLRLKSGESGFKNRVWYCPNVVQGV